MVHTSNQRTIMEPLQRRQRTKHHTARHVNNGKYSVENGPVQVQKQGRDENTQEDWATTYKRWPKRETGRLYPIPVHVYICCSYSMYGVVYLSSFLSLFHCRVVFWYSVSSSLTCFCKLFTGPSLLEIKFCSNFCHSSNCTSLREYRIGKSFAD